jgi:signal transduction histidine kinase
MFKSKAKALKYIFFVSLGIGIIFPLINMYYIYPSFTDLLIKNTEKEAIRFGTHLANEYFQDFSPGSETEDEHNVVSDTPSPVPIKDTFDETFLVYTIQAGSFAEADRANRQYESVINKLNKEDLDYLRIEKIGQHYSVRLGKLLDRKQGERFHYKVRPHLKNSVLMEAYIKGERIERIHAGDSLEAERTSVDSAAHPAPVSLAPVKSPGGEGTRDLDEIVKQDIGQLNLMKLKVFSASGETVYSSTAEDIGKVNKHDYFQNIVAKGTPYTKVVKKDRKSLEGQVVSADVVETYVPVMSEGKFEGAFEIYYDITASNKSLNRVVTQSAVVSFAMMIIFLGTITAMLFKQDKFMIRQQQVEEELKVFSDKLQESNQELENFAHIASHDLQEPLRKVIAFGDRLLAKYSGVLDETGRDYLARMQSATKRMQNLITSLLDFSRVTTKAQPFIPVNLTNVLNEVVADLEVRIEQSGGKVITTPLTTLEADPLQVRQLMQNLIGNSLKFSRKGTLPVVKVSGEIVSSNGGSNPDDKSFQLVVSDNGIGFDEKYADRIFGVFQRLHGRQEYEGTGIGLSICRRIVERHHGTISARSSPGEGTAFLITLPLKQQEGGIHA